MVKIGYFVVTYKKGNHMKKLIIIGAAMASCSVFATEWAEVPLEDGLDKVDSVQIMSQSKEETLSIFRKSAKQATIGGQFRDMVFVEFKTTGLDQISTNGPVIYKASKGKAYPLGSRSRLGGFTGKIQTAAFHGKPSATCGIIGNIIHSEKLTVRYVTAGNQIKDVIFDLPVNSNPVFKLLGFDKQKDCIEIN